MKQEEDRSRQRVLELDRRTQALSTLERRRAVEALAGLIRLAATAPRVEEAADGQD